MKPRTRYRPLTAYSGAGRTAVVLSVALALVLAPVTAATASPEESVTVTPPVSQPDTISAAEALGLPELPPNADELAIAEAATPSNHTIDIALVTPAGSAGSATLIADDGVAALIAQTAAYWKDQSGGQIASLTPSPVIRYATGNVCGDYSAIWNEAATKFGRVQYSDYVNSSSRHLLVMVPQGCGGPGLGTVGGYYSPVSTSNGGAILMSTSPLNNLDVVVHELGHNLGLKHSNTHVCPSAAINEGLYDPISQTFSDECTDKPYGDAYDAMGAAWSVNVNGTLKANPRPAALNVTHKNRLGVLGADETQTIALESGAVALTRTATIKSTGTTGLRALSVTDPVTGTLYYVDYRGGAGTDAGALYGTGWLTGSGFAPGVRLTTTRPNGTSVIIPSNGRLFLTPGNRIQTRSGGITVDVAGIANGSATVVVTVKSGTLTATPTPTITGTPLEGRTLTAVAGAWSPAPVNLSYQWSRDGVAVADAITESYALGAGDVDRTLTVAVTGSKTGHATVTRTSAPTTVIESSTPALTVAPTPTITGGTRVGYTLTARPGMWEPAPVTLAYQWYRSGAAVTGATAPTYALAPADLGAKITVRVTGSKAGYRTSSRTSAATTLIGAGIPALTVAVPAITGGTRVGYTLTARPGTWGPAPVTLAYQWYRSGAAVTGATGPTYALAPADLGAKITVRVTGSKTGYLSVSRTSAATATIGASTPALTVSVPTITGGPRVGYTLTVRPGTWGPAPVTLAYQWYRSGVAVAGATAPTHALTETDLGAVITVRVTGSKTGYASVGRTSVGTKPIGVPLTVTPAP